MDHRRPTACDCSAQYPEITEDKKCDNNLMNIVILNLQLKAAKKKTLEDII